MSQTIYRKLGRSGIEISAMGMGCWAIGGPLWNGEDAVGWGDVDDNESIAAVQKAIELGVRFFDTADCYGAGHSEEVLAKALEGKRQSIVIATKFGYLFDVNKTQATGMSAEPEYIKSACEESLKRLNTDYIDLYQFHLNDYDAQAGAAVRDVLEKLVAQGKIRAYGWSTDFADKAKVFAEGKNCAAIQCQMNVLDDAPEVVGVCEAEDLACINRGPLAMGLLTEKYNKDSRLGEKDVRGKNSPAWMKYFKKGKVSEEFLAKRDTIREILRSDGRTLTQGALAWLWGRSENTIPIPGFRTVKQVEETCGAMAKGALRAEQISDIDKLLER